MKKAILLASLLGFGLTLGACDDSVPDTDLICDRLVECNVITSSEVNTCITEAEMVSSNTQSECAACVNSFSCEDVIAGECNVPCEF